MLVAMTPRRLGGGPTGFTLNSLADDTFGFSGDAGDDNCEGACALGFQLFAELLSADGDMASFDDEFPTGVIAEVGAELFVVIVDDVPDFVAGNKW